jgi:hypothetical protein
MKALVAYPMDRILFLSEDELNSVTPKQLESHPVMLLLGLGTPDTGNGDIGK